MDSFDKSNEGMSGNNGNQQADVKEKKPETSTEHINLKVVSAVGTKVMFFF
ncbi:hypothetical protein LPJ57_006384 [Coemansia sp. RSA 486]|nr:hypothetical protein LPJ57_006384 [Coemansia sp. RSA 486]